MTALPKLRWMALLIAVGLGIINLSPEPAAVPDASIKTFTEWCKERAELPPETAHTVDRLLLLMGTKDCMATDALIDHQKTLILERLELQDLRHLSAFTQVTWLSLAVNDIEDIAPLQSFTNLEYLFLDSKNIADLQPLATLTNLKTLALYDNDIADLSPITALTQLDALSIYQKFWV